MDISDEVRQLIEDEAEWHRQQAADARSYLSAHPVPRPGPPSPQEAAQPDDDDPEEGHAT